MASIPEQILVHRDPLKGEKPTPFLWKYLQIKFLQNQRFPIPWDDNALVKFFSETKVLMTLGLVPGGENAPVSMLCWGRIERPLGGAVEHLLGGALATLWDEEDAGAGRQALGEFLKPLSPLTTIGHM